VARATRHEPPSNANLREVEFCAVSGQLPTAACSHRVRGWFIPGVSPISECEIHHIILVDAATGLRLNSDDGSRTVRREVAEFWPSDLLELFAQAGLPRKLLPPFAPNESIDALARNGKPPRITSPRTDVTYSLATTGTTSRTLTLTAETDADVATVYWFADRAFLGSTRRAAPLNWQPQPGHYTIIAMDDHGRSDSRPVLFTD
jgi:penicillin-binding protein 1C